MPGDMKTLLARTRPIRLFSAVVTAVTLCWSVPTRAQTATAASITSAFLYNFAKFTEWPSGTLAAGQRISLCVIGDSGVADALEQTIKGHAIEGHELTVEAIKADGPLRSCHLLYVSGLDPKRSLQLIESLKAAPVFTASDADKFAEQGGIAQLTLENGRMRFAINVTAAQRARLQLSSKLLNLAQIVKDTAHAQP
jgi:hypothetical protein